MKLKNDQVLNQTNIVNDLEILPLFSPDPSNPSGPWIAAFSWEKNEGKGKKEVA